VTASVALPRILDFPHAAEHVTTLLEAPFASRYAFSSSHTRPVFAYPQTARPSTSAVHGGSFSERSCPTKRGRGASRLRAQARDSDGSHLCFDDRAGRLALAWWRVATKTLSKLVILGPGMHWERGNVNPMLALRTAECLDRWRERWQKALAHHRKLQALHRSQRVKQWTQAFLAVGGTSSQEFPPSHSATVSEQLSPPAPPVINTITSPKCAFMRHKSKLAKICVSLSVLTGLVSWPSHGLPG